MVVHNIFQSLNAAGNGHTYYYPYIYPITFQVGDLHPLNHEVGHGSGDVNNGQQYYPVKQSAAAFNLFAYNKTNVYSGYKYDTSSVYPDKTLFAYNTIYNGSGVVKDNGEDFVYNQGNGKLTFIHNGSYYGTIPTTGAGFQNISGSSVAYDYDNLVYKVNPDVQQDFITTMDRSKYAELFATDELSTYIPILDNTETLVGVAPNDIELPNNKVMLKRLDFINHKKTGDDILIKRFTSSDVGVVVGARP